VIPEMTTDPIDLALVAGQPTTISHGLGRQITGWLIVWQDAVVDLYIQDATADTSKELVLVASATANVRLVLL